MGVPWCSCLYHSDSMILVNGYLELCDFWVLLFRTKCHALRFRNMHAILQIKISSSCIPCRLRHRSESRISHWGSVLQCTMLWWSYVWTWSNHNHCAQKQDWLPWIPPIALPRWLAGGLDFQTQTEQFNSSIYSILHLLHHRLKHGAGRMVNMGNIVRWPGMPRR